MSDRDMNEKNVNLWLEDAVCKKISDSAEEIPVPDSLLPEQISEKLIYKQKERKEKRLVFLQKAAGMAAAIVLVIALGTAGYYGFGRKISSDKISSGAQRQEELMVAESYDKDDRNSEEKREKKEYVGDLYHRANSYEEVYQIVELMQEEEADRVIDEAFMGALSGIFNGMASNEGYDSAAGIQESESDNTGNVMGTNDYSKTNVQVEGVDESDIIKNDGNYLYVASDYKVRIVDILSDQMQKVGEIHPEYGGSGGSMEIKEMYVDGDRLYLIASLVDTKLEESDSSRSSADVAYTIDTSSSIELMTYDIKDRTSPKLVGSVKQDGSYYTSRKVEDVIYLFSRNFFGAVREEEQEEIIPYIDGARVSADCIYIPEKGNSEMIISSVDVRKPWKTVDQMVILNNYADIYMGLEAIYLYYNEYQYDSGQTFTQIAKFSYKDGYMDAVSAASVKGSVEDTFAVSESNGVFRILTTDWSSEERVNQLYLLDANMKITGSIEDIARGESVYAARYMGDMAYFITYRNMDPLFVADLSDPNNPVLLGSLEISGFSDYLHPYGEDLLLGIGYETDPDTSMREGVKLCMFDISDPLKPDVIDTEVLKKLDNVPGVEFYKGILADPEKNLIGFLAEDYDNYNCAYYEVFRWDGEDFHEVLSQEITNEYSRINTRGVYAGKYFYVVTNRGITSYDMENGFVESDNLVF